MGILHYSVCIIAISTVSFEWATRTCRRHRGSDQSQGSFGHAHGWWQALTTQRLQLQVTSLNRMAFLNAPHTHGAESSALAINSH